MKIKDIKILAITHKNVPLEKIGCFHLEDTVVKERLHKLKADAKLTELMYLSTCNRVEFVFSCDAIVDDDFLLNFFISFNPSFTETELMLAVSKVEVFQGEDAARHLFMVASSIDSLVIGEREIITQVRTAYEKSKEMGLTGEVIRLLVRNTIKAAKAIYTKTQIATKPVSVVSLAYRKLRDINVKLDANVLIVGAGKTNNNMAKFLHKHGFRNFSVYNRTIANAQKLANELDGEFYGLSELINHRKPFDLIVTCTSSAGAIFTEELYLTILNGDKGQKVVIDLAIPNDFDRKLKEKFNLSIIAVEDLRQVAEENLKEREKELVKCEVIIGEQLNEFKQQFKERKVELAMQDVPCKVREIKKTALQAVFAKDYAKLDNDSKEVLDKVIAYIEKKYISVPMKMAKEIILKSAEEEPELN
ncbi:MAG: glutamyl-tRNA reductase [Flavobacteriales bacterium]